MKEKIYTSLSKVVDGYIRGVYDFFSYQTAVFKKQALEMKSSSYGGRDVLNLVANFNQRTSQKRDELLDKVKSLFAESGRKLSKKQYSDLKEKCTKPFVNGINTFKKALVEEFEWTSTEETSLSVLEQNVISSINYRIDTFKLMSSIHLDKALWWTALGTIFAGASLVLSIIALIISIVQ